MAFSNMVSEVKRALPALANAGVHVELIDPRTAKPLDRNLILDSVRKTGRLVVVDTGWTCCGISAEVAAIAAEQAFSSLKAPIRRVALPDIPTPTSAALEAVFYPGVKEIIQAVFDCMGVDGAESAAATMVSQTQSPMEPETFRGPF